MKKNKRRIILISIIILLFLVTFIIIKINNEKNKTENIEENTDISTDIDEKFEVVSDHNLYYTVRTILDDYISYLVQINGDEDLSSFRIEGSIDEIAKEEMQDGINSMYDVLDSQYIEECNINEDSIKKIADKYKVKGTKNEDVDYRLNIEKMYSATTDAVSETNIALLKATLNGKDFNIIVKLDFENETYSIFENDYLEKNNYNEDTKISEINISNESIKYNTTNKFYPSNISLDYVASDHFEEFKNSILNYTEESYNYLDEEYKNSEFENIEKYKEFVNNNYNKISEAEFEDYEMSSNKDYTEYICKSNNGIIYTFKEDSTDLSYTVKISIET